MGDPIQGLVDGLAARNHAPASDAVRIRREYSEWLSTVAAAAFRKITETVAASGATVHTEEATVNGSERLGVSIRRPGSPKAFYILYLHPSMDAGRAVVMTRVHEFDMTAGPLAGSQPMRANAYPFFDQMRDGRTNDAKAITEADIIRDFTAYYLAHRDRWG